MSALYLFIFFSHFSLLVCSFIKLCYYLGRITRRYINTKLGLTISPEIPVSRVNQTRSAVFDIPATRMVAIRRTPVLHIENDDSNDTENNNDTDSDDSSAYDSDEDIDISNSEFHYEDQEKIAGKSYIGIAYLDEPHGVYLMNGTISVRSFFAFDYSRIRKYTRNISLYYVRPTTELDILRLHIHPDGVYEVTVHTYWIRIIQRAWRKVYAQRKHTIRLRGNVYNQEYFRNNGRYMLGTRVLPTIHGMLA